MGRLTTAAAHTAEGQGWPRLLLTRVAAVGLMLAVIGVPSPPVAAADHGDLARLQAAQRGVELADQRHAAVLAELQAAAERRAALERDLGELDARLTVAEAAVAREDKFLRSGLSQLLVLDDRLQLLRQKSQVEAQRSAQTTQGLYRFGRLRYADVVLGGDDLPDVAHAVAYAEVVMRERQQAVRSVAEQRAAAVAAREQVDTQRNEVSDRRAALAAERDRLAGLVSQRRELLDRLTAEADRQEALLAGIESDRAAAQALVAALEDDSRRLADDLRRQAGNGVVSAEYGLTWPAEGPVTSPFGWRTHPISGAKKLHEGVDIGAASGAEIRAATDGIVVSAGWRGGYGNAVVIDHGNGLATLYAHQSSLAVAAGERVAAGQVVGYVGATGYVTGPHLHYEVRSNGAPVDPQTYRL